MIALPASVTEWGAVAPTGSTGSTAGRSSTSSAVFSSEELDAYLGSYVGMNGNPAAAVWFCDVTPHADSTPLIAPLEPLCEPIVWDNSFRQKHQDNMMRWQRHQKTARIMAAARNAVLRTAICDWKDYFSHRLYAPSSGEYRISLFPLPAGASGNRDWSKAHRNQPALNPQRRYVNLCREGRRFRFIAGLRQRMRPKVIVCLGTGNADDFLRAFGFSNAAGTDAILQPADLPKRLQIFTDAGTTLVISPTFGGAAGINPDALLDALGSFTAQWLVASDFPPPSEEVQTTPHLQ